MMITHNGVQNVIFVYHCIPFGLRFSGSVARCQPDQQVCHCLHGLDAGVFKAAVVVCAAGAEVRTGQSHIGEPGTVGTAPDGGDLRLDAKLAQNAAGVFHQMRMRRKGFLHIIIGICHLHCHGALTVFFIQEICTSHKQFFFLLK